MNKRVFVSMVVLVVAFLLGMYILKFFFPEHFLFAIENDTIIEIGNYIDSHAWAAAIFYFVIGVIFDWLYFGSVCQKLIPKTALAIIIVICNLAYSLYSALAPNDVVQNNALFVSAISTCYMLLMPIFFNKNVNALSITYCVNYFSQALSLAIRSIALNTANLNALTTVLLSFDNYLWLALCFIVFNYKRKEIDYGKFETPVREQKEQILREENRESRKENQEAE